MPDFRVIDGGGNGRGQSDYEADMARRQMDTLIEIPRAVARGDDHENRVGRTLIQIFNTVGLSVCLNPGRVLFVPCTGQERHFQFITLDCLFRGQLSTTMEQDKLATTPAWGGG